MPSDVVLVVLSVPVSIFLATTVAPEMTAPCWSTTVPVIVAVAACPKHNVAMSDNDASIIASRVKTLLIMVCLLVGLIGYLRIASNLLVSCLPLSLVTKHCAVCSQYHT